VVALGTATAFGDTATDPAALTAASATGAVSTTDLADRQATLDRATRGDNRTDAASTVDQLADFWVLPLNSYTFSTPFGVHSGTIHPGVDLAVPEGTAYVAAHAGTVVLARFAGGNGYEIVIDGGNGIRTIYGHSSALLVREGQKVEAGQVIGLSGNSGYSLGPRLLFGIEQNGNAVDPVTFLLTKGVDIANKTQAVDS
jgi:murein DD-endopeptidase MepM/ murein hydrolase activator NlpD